MFLLVTVDGPEKGKSIELKPNISILMGRDKSNQFSLNDKSVSRIHACISIDADRNVILSDWNSSNGTWLRGKKIDAPVQLVPGDVFYLGESAIKLALSNSYEKEKDFVPGMEGVRHNLQGAGQYTPAASHTRVLNVGSEINIGRDPSNDIVLKHPMVSRFHAKIEFQAGSNIIYDLNSVNGTYVNGRRLEKSMLLPKDSLIQICGYRYVFDGTKLIEYDDNSGQLRIQINQLTKTVQVDGKPRKLLDNISLCIQPREFVAILGGSGAGKSTFMGALTGMNPPSSGQILINGCNLYEEYGAFRSMIGFVPQDDIVHEDLSVEEVLTYSARLRMPEDTSKAEINNIVDTVINNLELDLRRNVLVKNLSGGQRKRVSIGVELLTSPSMFFLDEPTSGLDPGLEKSMMEMLRKLANQGRTVVLVTHATFNINLCDRVIFLGEGGRLAFWGTPSEALAYFNAADFAEIYLKLSMDKSPQQWAFDYRESDIGNMHLGQMAFDSTPVSSAKKYDSENLISSKTGNSSFKQWSILTARYVRLMSRDRKNLGLLFLQPVIIAFLMVLVFMHTIPTFTYSEYQEKELEITEQVLAEGRFQEIQDKIQDETTRRASMSMSLAMMLFTTIWLGTSNSAREIVKELNIYRRERRVNLRVTPYLMSKVGVMSMVCLIQTIIFISILHITLGLPEYLLSLTAFFLISLASMMMGLTVSAIASNTDKAMSMVPILLVPQIVLSGALIPISSVKPEILQKIFYLAISKWGYELVGGGICHINQRVVLKTGLDAFSGNFVSHWWILLGFVVVLCFISKLTILRKERL